ncbi:hypothetical protein BGZ82_004844, partial [Podila clonocystis]
MTMGEATFLVALTMGEVIYMEKSNGMFKPVLAKHNVLVGPLAQASKGYTVSNSEHEKGSKELQKAPSHTVAKASTKSQPDIHRRTFDMKHMTKSEREAWIKSYEVQYTTFGFIVLGLELVPVVGTIFGLTNVIG